MRGCQIQWMLFKRSCWEKDAREAMAGASSAEPREGGVQGAGEGEAEMLPQLVVSERRQPLRGPPAGDKERG